MYFSISLIVWLGVLLPWQPADGARILLVAIEQLSHMAELHSIGSELVRRGHDVYSVLPESFPGIERVVPPAIKILPFQQRDNEDVRLLDLMDGLAERILNGSLVMPWTISRAVHNQCSAIMNDKRLVAEMEDIRFDLAVVDGFPLMPCSFLVPYNLSVPYISYSSGFLGWEVRVPSLPSFVPSPFMPFTHQMSFWQRALNVFLHAALVLEPLPPCWDYTLLHKFAPGVTSWAELRRKVAFFIVSRDHMLEWPQPSLPNVVFTPGITATEARPLPAELELIVKSKRVIVVSFGSTVGNLPKEVTQKFLAAFRRTKATILWKVGDADWPAEVPSNVKLLKWMPQNDVLGHVSVKLFVTHCGNNGQYEALYHGVPMIGFPMFADQHHNAVRMQDHGYGVAMDVSTFGVDDLVRNIEHVMSDDSSYRKATLLASRIIKHNPMNARETAAYWVEHVLSYGGGHLRSHAVNMPWYEFLLLDVLCFYVLFLLICCCIGNRALKRLCRFYGKRETKNKIKQH